MDRKTLSNISGLSRIQGLLEAMAAMRGASITDKLSLEIECAAERLVLFISDLIGEVSRDNEETISNLIEQIADKHVVDVIESTPDQ